MALLTLSLVSACGGGFSLEKAAPDRALVTSAIPAAAPAPAKDGDQISDETTIRNAVSSADLAASAGKPLAWANADTGSRGEITGLAESSGKGGVCRSFRATRERYDGVRLFRGEACLAAGAWQMTGFDPA